MAVQAKKGGKSRAAVGSAAAKQLHAAKKDLKRRKMQLERNKEESMLETAVDFLGLSKRDVADLKVQFKAIDIKRRGVLKVKDFFAFSGCVTLARAQLSVLTVASVALTRVGLFSARCRIDRSPLLDALFYFMDAEFDGRITFPIFVRTVCTFCMFGSQELVAWVYTVVASNLTSTAEAADPMYHKKSYKPGVHGFDPQRRLSVYWHDVVKWHGMEQPPGAMTLQAFNNLMYYLHSPTGTVRAAIKRSLMYAKDICKVEGVVSASEFTKIVTAFPSLLAPLFMTQTVMRQRFMGEAWWGEKRQLFADARDVIREQFANAARMAQLRREEAAAKEEAQKAAGAASGGTGPSDNISDLLDGDTVVMGLDDLI